MKAHRAAPNRVSLRLESLEPRLQLSATVIEYPVDFMGPLTEGGRRTIDVKPMEVATGVTLADTSPTLGGAIVATLDTVTAPYTIVSTTWTARISNGPFTSTLFGPMTATNTDATFGVNIPGTYTIEAYTTYASTNPSLPPLAPTTKTATATVTPPTTVTPTSGFGIPVFAGTIPTVLSDVSSAKGKLQSFAGGWMQERIPYYIDINNVSHAGPANDDWAPADGATTTFSVFNGVLYDQMTPTSPALGGVSADWSAAPVGGVYREYFQQLRYVWSMSVPGPNGPVQVPFYADLNTLHWQMKKESVWTWSLNLM